MCRDGEALQSRLRPAARFRFSRVRDLARSHSSISSPRTSHPVTPAARRFPPPPSFNTTVAIASALTNRRRVSKCGGIMRVLFIQNNGIQESICVANLSGILKANGHQTDLLLVSHTPDLIAAIRRYDPG